MKNAVIAFLLLVSPLWAEKPNPVIEGPREVHSGALVVLDAGGSAGAETFGWLVDTSAVQVPGTKTPDVSKQVDELRALGFTVAAPVTDEAPLYEVEEGGKRIRLSSYPGTYRLVLGVSNSDGVSLLEWKVTVDGVKPPDPKPPTPDVEPNLPAGKFGLAIKSWRAAMAVNSPGREDESKMLAGALLMSAAAADGQGMVDGFAAAMKEKFTPEQKKAWEPWRAAFLTELSSLQGSGKLITKDDFLSAFSELALGLSAVEK